MSISSMFANKYVFYFAFDLVSWKDESLIYLNSVTDIKEIHWKLKQNDILVGI